MEIFPDQSFADQFRATKYRRLKQNGMGVKVAAVIISLVNFFWANHMPFFCCQNEYGVICEYEIDNASTSAMRHRE